VSEAHRTVAVVPHDPRWRDRFRETRAQLLGVLPTAVVEHVGSTSVPGLSSKDTIDVAVGVPDVAAALRPATLEALAARGFVHRPESFADSPDHAFLDRIVAGHRTDHVHVLRLGSERWTDRILFRDFLRADPGARRRYERAKRELAARYPDRRDRYVDLKQPVVEALMVEARAWAVAAGPGAPRDR
jgi:GrpB-like predicted nucleotidyltransferase (UPF0157 family)